MVVELLLSWKAKGWQPHRLQFVCAVSWMIIQSHESLSYFCAFGCKVLMGIGSLNVVSKYSCFDMLLFYLLFICLITEIPLKQMVDILHMLLIRLKNSKTILEFLYVYKSLLQCKLKMKHEQEQKLVCLKNSMSKSKKSYIYNDLRGKKCKLSPLVGLRSCENCLGSLQNIFH